MTRKLSIKVAKPCIGEEEVEAVRDVLLSGRYVSGLKVKEFEDLFARYIGVKHAIAVNSGTAALHCVLAALGVGPGDEVIVPPLTFFSTVTAVLHQNAIPIFADIDLTSYCLDPEDVKRKITSKTKAVVPVHLFGNAADMSSFRDIRNDYGVKIVEDCAQAHGTELTGKKVGGFGDAGAFSFFATKHMTTGEGGMVTTNSDEIAEHVRLMRSHGMSNRDDHIILGYNYRMTEIAAAMGIIQLGKLGELNSARIENSKYLIERIKDIEWLSISQKDLQITHTFFWCPVLVNEEMLGMSTYRLVTLLKEAGVEVRQRYSEPLYKQKLLMKGSPYPNGCPYSCHAYAGQMDYGKVYLHNVEKVAGRLIGLPNHPDLRREELDYIVAVMREITP